MGYAWKADGRFNKEMSRRASHCPFVGAKDIQEAKEGSRIGREAEGRMKARGDVIEARCMSMSVRDRTEERAKRRRETYMAFETWSYPMNQIKECLIYAFRTRLGRVN